VTAILIYFYGTADGKLIKIGKTAGSLALRRDRIQQGQFTKLDLRLLAAVRGQPTSEKALHGEFHHLRVDAESTEVFRAEPELVEYINWLRQQWWTWLDEDEGPDDLPHYAQWSPGPGRRLTTQAADPGALVQLYDVTAGYLAGTPWALLSTPPPLYNDFYTPPSLIRAAREAMGGLDLDAASHWAANRVHRIPLYYHVYRDAFQNPWRGKVWLNPPYGNNAPWFAEAVKYLDSGEMEQFCMLSQMSVFITGHARPLLRRAELLGGAMLILTPTPTFWGYAPANEKRRKKARIVAVEECESPDGQRRDSGIGTDLPHAVLYVGPRVAEFKHAFRERGFILPSIQALHGT
jgi:hypothetical protein